MPIFSYKALNRDGETKRGKLAAENESDLEGKLHQSGLEMLSCSQHSQSSLMDIFSKISDKDLTLVCVHLKYLEMAGVPILESIGDLRDNSENPKIREVMMDIYDSLKNGKLFSEAISMHPQIFDQVFVGLIKAGERSGNFSEIFQHLEGHYKWVAEIKKRITKATTYPMFLLFVMLIVITVMMIFVIPKLTVFLKSQNIDLPAYAVALINTSDFVVNYWWALIPAPIITYITIKIACNASKHIADNADYLKLKLPLVGSIIRKIEIARFCHFFSILYRSGLGIIECLEVSKSVMTNNHLKNTISKVADSVTNGTKLTTALIETGEFPQLVIRMFKVGEESGSLDQSLHNINIFYESEINSSIDGMVGALQPILTLIMGGLLMWITASVFGPIYGSFGNVGK